MRQLRFRVYETLQVFSNDIDIYFFKVNCNRLQLARLLILKIKMQSVDLCNLRLLVRKRPNQNYFRQAICS